jgi:acetyl esterase/lipase
MKHTFLFLALVSVCSHTYAQEKIFLYPSDWKVTKEGFDKDTLPPYFDYFKANPDSANGSAILILPGGGYQHLSVTYEGEDVARYFNQRGFETFVLHYRLNNAAQQGHQFPDQFNDVTTAIRIIKSRAKEWKVDPDRVGVLGFSAGGHLSSMLATMHLPANKKSKDPLEHWSSRPAFAILIYPVISLAGKAAHAGSRTNLLGQNPDNILVDSLSTHNRVNEFTPPTFLVYANDDNSVPPENGIMFYQALRKYNIPVSLHIYDHGGHGFGMGPKDKVLSSWPWLCREWLRRQNFR